MKYERLHFDRGHSESPCKAQIATMKISLSGLFAGGFALFGQQAGLAATYPLCPDAGHHMCLYSPVDPAGSKGSQSLAIGLGLTSTGSSESVSEEAKATGHYPRQLLRVHVTKGFSLPIDVGFLLGTTETAQFQQAGFHAQWTLFEGFRLPAFTVRGMVLRSYWSRLTENSGGLEMESVDSRSLNFLTSWGILGVLTPYAGFGWAAVGDDSSIEDFAGIEIQAAPPFMRIGIEARTAFSKRSVLAKISLGL